MRLLFVRHGETVDNVAGLYAGVTDSSLTNHGVLQAQRLGSRLAERYVFTHIYSSDLQRARNTAKAVFDAQITKQGATRTCDEAVRCSVEAVRVLTILREQDFGSLEGRAWTSTRSPGSSKADLRDFVPAESKPAMDVRANEFVSKHIIPLLEEEANAIRAPQELQIVVVSHGILLSRLWNGLLAHCCPHNLRLAADMAVGPRGIENIAWSNTGYLELDISLENTQVVLTQLNLEQGAAEPAGPQLATVDMSTAFTNSSKAILSTAARLLDPVIQSTQRTHAKNDKTAPCSQVYGSAEDRQEQLRKMDSVLHNMHECCQQLPEPFSMLVAQRRTQRITILVRKVNAIEHLKGLKRTRGGVGSAAHDDKQRLIDNFFKRTGGGVGTAAHDSSQKSVDENPE